MADDAGALLVRSGLVTSSALDEARSRVEDQGGTLGEQLVIAGAVADDDLTDFYRQRLLVPQVNPNTLARLPQKVVSSIPTDMAIELRAIPVSLDAENNLTVAMSDPSDRHAVDEIAFFTSAYVVRAVATQMQIAWCLAHYYGHVTPLGQRLIQPSGQQAAAAAPGPIVNRSAAVVARMSRTKGLTGKVEATRHRAIAPVSGPVDMRRPLSGELDLGSLAAAAELPAPPATAVEPRPIPAPSVVAAAPVAPASEPDTRREVVPRHDAVMQDTAPSFDGIPDRPRARSVSGEIRVPSRRAASIRPPMPPIEEDDDEEEIEIEEAEAEEDDDAEEDSGPVIVMEADAPEEAPTGPRMVPVRRRVKTDPPELAARAGEIGGGASRPIRDLDADEPRIIIADDDLAEPGMGNAEKSGELAVVARPATSDGEPAAPVVTIEVDDTSVGIVIHDYLHQDSEPVLLERRRPSDPPVTITLPAPPSEDGEDPDDDDIVVLDARKPVTPRPEKRTQIGMGPAVAAMRSHRDTEAMAVPATIDDGPTEAQTIEDPTRVDRQAAPPRSDDTDETLALPPSPAHADETSPHIAPPAAAIRPRAGSVRPLPVSARAITEDEDSGPIELDDAIPQLPAHLGRASRRRVDYDAVDDGWGPPGTTIPPPLLGAMPGSDEGDDDSTEDAIPMPDVDSAPLIVAPPSPPEPARGAPALRDASGPSLVRALEDATSRSIELIHALERAKDRDGVIALMIAHLAETHRRAGFFSIKPGVGRTGAPDSGPIRGSELSVFSIEPVPAVLPVTTLRLDNPSTLQDVVDTRLPYRGPMHDDASRNFLASVLGACPPEILVVPVAVRERVVGVLFGEHRMRHTFDDQLALAARAAGMSLERILKAKRI